MRLRLRYWFISLGLALSLVLTTGPPALQPAWGAAAVGLQDDFIRVAEKVMPAVVSLKAIRVVTLQPFGPSEDFFRGTPFEGMFREFGGGQPIRRRTVGQGSGVIIDDRGYILTNNHVVAGSQQLVVHLNDGREVKGQLVGADPRFDLALVKVPAAGLRAANMGDSSKIRVGQWAIAIGSPFGLEKTMTVGIISATGRRGLGRGTFGDFIQTDASINPGNSGGPLLDINGQVIGINSMISAQGQGIGFAIPINLARQIVSPWMK
ncbi:MAG: trypsin-like peptidase domain-containing protein [Thermodesulfobacteriota bacterium]